MEDFKEKQKEKLADVKERVLDESQMKIDLL